MAQPSYRIVSRGEIMPGFSQPQVSANLSELCKYKADTLAQIFSGRTFVFKAGLDAETAKRYHQALRNAGVACSVEPMPAQARDQAGLPTSPPRTELRREPPVNEITCPKCGQRQPESLTCTACGIAFAKYQRQREADILGKPSLGMGQSGDSGGSTGYTRGTAGGRKFAALMRLVVVLAVVIGGGYYGLQYFSGRGSDQVVIYTFGNDEACDAAKAYLDSQAIDYVEYVIDASEENAKKFLDASRQKNLAPLAFIGGIRIDGYKPAMYQIAVAKYKGSLKDVTDNQIVMYSAANCGFCKRAANFFAKHKIDYDERDIASPMNLAKYRELGGIGTPLIMVGKVRIDGFDEEALTLAMQEFGRL